MKLAYKAIDQGGRMVSDTIDAGDATQAAEMLHHRGLFVAEIAPTTKQGSSSSTSSWGLQTEGRRLKHMATFARHLYVLLSSGVQITQALVAMERQTRDVKWQAVIAQVRRKVEDGSSFAAALEEHPKFFDPITCNLVSAGETSGNLEEMLERVAQLTRAQLTTRRQIVGGLTYPVLVVAVSINVVAMLITVVLPRFSELFTAMNVPLPPTTKVLMRAGDWLSNYWWIALLMSVAAIVGTWRYLLTKSGRRLIDTLMLRIPGVGHMTRNFATARIIRMLGVLFGSHVGMLESLRLTRNAVGNSHYAELLTHAEDVASKGNSLSHAFADTDLINPTVYEALHNGEHSGTLDTLLLHMADFMDEDNDVILKTVLSVLSPAILALLGVLVGFIAVSLFLPLFDLTAAGAGGGAP